MDDKISITTPEELAVEANKEDIGFHDKENQRFSFYAYMAEVFGKISTKINVTFRW